MTEKKNTTRGSRMGKHKPSKVSIGMYVDEDFRALLALLVDVTGDTATDIMMDGVRQRAKQVGILTASGMIAAKYQPAINVIKAVFAEKRRKK